MFRIEITLPSGETQTHTFQDSALSIGRMLGQVQLQDPGISALHGQLTLEDGKVSYRDLGSAQGSFLPDGTPIRYTVAMQPGDRVKLGGHQLALIEFKDTEKPAAQQKPNPEPVVVSASEEKPHQKRRKRARLPKRNEKTASPESAPAAQRAPTPESAPPDQASPSTPSQAPAQTSSAPATAATSPRTHLDPPPKRATPASVPAIQRPLSESEKKTEALRRIYANKSSKAAKKTKQRAAELSPTKIQFAGRERNAPWIDPSAWESKPKTPPTHASSLELLRKHFGPLVGSGPILIASLGTIFVLLAGLAPLNPAFFGLLFVVVFALVAHASVAWSLSIIDLLSEDKLRPLSNWKRVGKLSFSTRGTLLIAFCLSAPLLFVPLLVLPVGLLEQTSAGGAIKRGLGIFRNRFAALAWPLFLFSLSICGGAFSLFAAPYLLPGWQGLVASVAGGVVGVLAATIFGMRASLHIFRVYFWQCAQTDPKSPPLRPALILPDHR